MQLRALAHRSTALSLRRQMNDVSGGRVFTTVGTKPRNNVGDAVEPDEDDEEGEDLPAVVAEQAAAREAGLVGELSDCTEAEDSSEAPSRPSTPASPCSAWDSEEDYPMDVRVLARPLQQVLQDAEEWRKGQAASTPPTSLSDSPASAPAQATSGGKGKKKMRRGGRASKTRSSWSEAQRKAEKNSAAYANRTALLRAMRQNERLLERHDAAPPIAGKHLDGAQQYASSFKVAGVATNRSPFVAARLAPAGRSGTTSPVYREGFSRVGISPASRSNIRWVLRQALGPPEGCNEYTRNLVKNAGFTYVPNATCAVPAFPLQRKLTYW
ncbi:hypothetical protein AURDEDRAFT_132059 [Auricularia subglabra TFB-10046 SS5]|uniref:Uncharacterized protein n=1 Tax=Auricularia subglabra (strain TFB-10046 / SS5) TaxID=717982 RepID=J0L8G7_AURST|nr:hypothetical protein AURDEDRAFT_132059 [Auricularia subglabra TFB-10046 SS5]